MFIYNFINKFQNLRKCGSPHLIIALYCIVTETHVYYCFVEKLLHDYWFSYNSVFFCWTFSLSDVFLARSSALSFSSAELLEKPPALWFMCPHLTVKGRRGCGSLNSWYWSFEKKKKLIYCRIKRAGCRLPVSITFETFNLCQACQVSLVLSQGRWRDRGWAGLSGGSHGKQAAESVALPTKPLRVRGLNVKDSLPMQI